MKYYSKNPEETHENVSETLRLVREELKKYRVTIDDDGNKVRRRIPSEKDRGFNEQLAKRRHEIRYANGRTIWSRRWLRENPHRGAELLDPAQAVRIRKAENQRNSRAARKASRERFEFDEAELDAALAEIEVPTIDVRAVLKHDLQRLVTWLASPSPRANQLRSKRVEIARARAAQLDLRNRLGVEPSHAQLAQALTGSGKTVTRDMARRKAETLAWLEGPEGPWKDSPGRIFS